MKCNKCGCVDSKVIDSRQNEDGTSIRRRRECLECKTRFTTYEELEKRPILVIKRDGTRESFDLGKIRKGVMKACEKRPVTAAVIATMLDTIDRRVYNTMLDEIEAKHIGDILMEELKKVDSVAYIRFASVYRDFRDVTSFVDFIGDLDNKKIEEEK